MADLISVTDYRRWSRDFKTEDADIVESAIAAAKAWIENETGRRWEVAGASSSARSFRAERCTDVLWIDDCAEIVSVAENGATLTANVDYVAEPLNGLDAVGNACAITALRRVSAYWYHDGPIPRVVITARWGQPSIPAGIIEAAKYATDAILRGREFTGGIIAVSEAGAFSERDAKVLRDAVRQYRGHKTWGIA